MHPNTIQTIRILIETLTLYVETGDAAECADRVGYYVPCHVGDAQDGETIWLDLREIEGDRICADLYLLDNGEIGIGGDIRAEGVEAAAHKLADLADALEEGEIARR